MPVPNPNYAPATPPATSDGAESYYTRYTDQGEQPLLRESTASLYSGTRTPRFSRSNTTANVQSYLPSCSLPNRHHRRRTRSASCSSMGSRVNSLQAVHEEDVSRSTKAPKFRRRSSADTERGELGVRIPHYRLGTPRFSDRGTAYLHSSIYTNSSVPSSVLSQAEFEKIFPIPPGRGISFLAAQSNRQLRVPSTARAPSNDTRSRSLATRSAFSSNRPSTLGFITPDTFDKIEDNLDNPAFVHYHPATGRIVAATVSNGYGMLCLHATMHTEWTC